MRQWRGKTLTDSMRYFLETGEHRLRDRFPWAKDRLEIFLLAKLEARTKLHRVWLHFRDEIMAGWRGQGRPGLPWAGHIFGGQNILPGHESESEGGA